MKGKYKTVQGDAKEVLMFDEINKMVYVNVYASLFVWVHESEYSKWVKEGEAVAKIPEPPMPVLEKVALPEVVVPEKEILKPATTEVKNKTTPKKKDK